METYSSKLIFLRVFIAICLLEASVFSGASQQTASSENDFLTGLVRSVANSNNVEVQGDAETEMEAYSFDDPVINVLTEMSVLGSLDFVDNVYESADFYENGSWGYAGKSYHSDIYTGPLPDCDMQDFIRPVIGGRLTSPFGYRETFRRLHKGIDISVEVGDVVRAALPGIVGRIGYEPRGYGHFLILVHSNGVETRYAHLSEVTATVGQRVAAGDEIALGGNSGNSTGPHLHFEVRMHGKALDPMVVFEDL